MLFFSIVLLALAIELVLGAARARTAFGIFAARLHAAVPQNFAPFALCALAVAFAVELVVIDHAARLAFVHLPWVARLPIPTVTVYPVNYVPQTYRAAFAALSVLQTLLLAGFLLATHDRPWRRIDTIASTIAGGAITVLAVASPSMTVADMYAYVAYALLGPGQAYAPPGTVLPGEFAIIHEMWGRPIVPAAYGPLWIRFNTIVVGIVASLYAKLIVLRLVNVVMLGVTLGALRALAVAPQLIAATAANPAIAFYYVTNGHNDLVVIAVILVAMTLAKRSPISAGIVAGIGASLKLTLVVPAAAIAVAIATLPRRVLYVTVMFVTASIIALVLGGAQYIHALSVVAAAYGKANSLVRVRVPHIMVIVVTLLFTALAVYARRTYRSVALSFVSLAQAYYPWYLIWGVPYAVNRSDSFATLLVAFPVMAAVLDSIHFKYLGALIVCMLVLALGLSVVKRMTLRRTATSSST